MSSDVKRILVIQTAFIGDTALALFFAQRLKNNYPDAAIEFVATPVSAEFVSKAKCISKCYAYDKRNADAKFAGIKKKADEINQGGKFDLLFCLHKSLRSSLLAKHIDATTKIGFEDAAISCVYDRKAKYFPHLHEIERNAQLLETLELSDTNNLPELMFSEVQFPKEIRQYVDDLKFMKSVLIAPGSVWNTKKWLPEYFRDTALKLENFGYQVGVIGAKNEIELCDYVATACRGARNFAGKVTLAETIAIMKYSNLVICNDSAPTHLAMLAGIPSVTIYGATAPLFGFYPRGKNSVAVCAEDLECQPCMIHGSDQCPRLEKKLCCLKQVTPERVAEIAENILKNSR